ncbi:hypothetical protein D3C76_942730 [compost metagenome]
MHHGKIAGMKPATRKGLGGGLRILQVAHHRHVAAEHHFANAAAIARHRREVLGVQDRHIFLSRITHALSTFAFGQQVGGKLAPFLVLGTYHSGTVDLCQTVYLQKIDAHAMQRRNHRQLGRSATDQAMNTVADPGFPLLWRMGQHGVHHRRAAVMGNAVLSNHRQHALRLTAAKTHVSTGVDRHGPGEAPAIAMEHGQSPQEDGVTRHLPVEHI